MNKTKLSNLSLGNWLKLGIGGSGRRNKGHFVVYSKGGKRFVVPLTFLDHPIFQVLLEMAEEELGTGSRGPLTVPCDDELMTHLLSLLKAYNPFDQSISTVKYDV
jgi:Auxin responsive protein